MRHRGAAGIQMLVQADIKLLTDIAVALAGRDGIARVGLVG